ncbi:peptidase family c78 domain-containing protein [Rhizoctonia solani AG-1 IA]|uniref:Peptidase family c78 domain-containing protein n=1 Tax=Thanatephorus cucumeris (strain AG1-IA) TaxID=983506 RepID=L8WR28_THACA|nr:peptidase family c78 domain-containing protein [Rhizoctonia solani AG-1 IA]
MRESLVSTADDDNKEPLQELSPEGRETHYEAHFNHGDGLEINELDAQLHLNPAICIQGSSPSRGIIAPVTHSSLQRVIPPQKPRENVFWHPDCGSPVPPRLITPGIIPILARALERPGSKGGALCTPLVFNDYPHRERVVYSRWPMSCMMITHCLSPCRQRHSYEMALVLLGCGYRNFLMACSALAAQDICPEYRRLLMDDICGPPGVRNLQVWIEDAWRRGEHIFGVTMILLPRLAFYGHDHIPMMSDTIRMVQLSSATTYLGLENGLVQLGFPHLALIQWLTAHFMEQSNDLSSGPNGDHTTPHVYMSTKMPIVLQHKGHSRTVVGIELTKSGETNILIYDPARRPDTAIRKAGLKVHASGVTSVGLNLFPLPQKGHKHRSSTKAKGFFNRVIKRRPHNEMNEQTPKRMRGGAVDNDNCESSGKENGYKLGPVEDRGHNNNGSLKDSDTNFRANSEIRPSEDNADLLGNVFTTQVSLVSQQVSLSTKGFSEHSKKDQYQILWFPMTAPLTGPERDACKIVRSERMIASVS